MKECHANFLSSGIFSAEQLSEASMQVYAMLSKSVHDHSLPIRLVVFVEDNFRPTDFKFLKGLAELKT